MDYKRKVSSQQEGVDGYDEQFGKLKLLAKSKCLMPIIFAMVMLFLVICIFVYGNGSFTEHMVTNIMGVVFIIIAILQLTTISDKIEFYEYGLIDYTFLNVRKRRLAYDDIEAIVEVKKMRFTKNSENARVSMWRIYPKNGKGSIVIDATAYIGVSHIMVCVRHDTKIKNIAD